MQNELLITLQEYGLSEKEARIYLVTLEIGSAPASVIARRSTLKRVTTYAILQDLVRKEYMRVLLNQGVKTFYVIEPDVLLKQQQQKWEKFETMLPAFSAVANTRDKKPKMEYYDGLQGLKELYTRILDEADTGEIVGFLSSESIDASLQKYLYEKHAPERVNRNIFAKILVPNTSANQKYMGLDNMLYKETRGLTDDFLNISCEINLLGTSKIAILLYAPQDMCAVYIDNKHLYAVLYGFFSCLWNQAGES